MYFPLVLLSIFFSPPEYLDPGSGSIIIQLVIAAVLGLGVIVRSQWSRIKSMFGDKPVDSDDKDEEKDEE